jgi:hypothetical protein
MLHSMIPRTTWKRWALPKEIISRLCHKCRDLRAICQSNRGEGYRIERNLSTEFIADGVKAGATVEKWAERQLAAKKAPMFCTFATRQREIEVQASLGPSVAQPNLQTSLPLPAGECRFRPSHACDSTRKEASGNLPGRPPCPHWDR